MSSSMKKLSWCLTKTSFLLTSVYDTGRHFPHYQRREVIITITQYTLAPTMVMCLQVILVQQWHRYYGSNQPF